MIRILKNKIFHFLLFILLIEYRDGYAAEDFIVFKDDLKANILSSDISPEDQLIIKNAIDTVAQSSIHNDDYETRFEPSNIESEETLLILYYINDKQEYESVGMQEYRISNKCRKLSNIRLVGIIKALLDDALFHESLYMLATTKDGFQGFTTSDRNLE